MHNGVPLPDPIYIDQAPKKHVLCYRMYIITQPPTIIDCTPSKAGGMLLALDDDVPEPATVATASQPLTNVPTPETLKGLQKFMGQEYRFHPGAREVEYYVRAPQQGINANTGLMLLSHNWGGTWKLTAP